MFCKTLALSAAAVLAMTLVVPAEAAKKASPGVELSAAKKKAKVAERPRSRVIVRKRSYLDPGTEVYPGSKSYTDYAIPFNYRPSSAYDPTGNFNSTFMSPWELRSYHTPNFGY